MLMSLEKGQYQGSLFSLVFLVRQSVKEMENSNQLYST